MSKRNIIILALFSGFILSACPDPNKPTQSPVVTSTPIVSVSPVVPPLEIISVKPIDETYYKFGPGSKGVNSFGPGSKGVSNLRFNVNIPESIINAQAFSVKDTDTSLILNDLIIEIQKDAKAVAIVTIKPKEKNDKPITFDTYLVKGSYGLVVKAEGNFKELKTGSLVDIANHDTEAKIVLYPTKEADKDYLDIAIRTKPLN